MTKVNCVLCGNEYETENSLEVLHCDDCKPSTLEYEEPVLCGCGGRIVYDYTQEKRDYEHGGHWMDVGYHYKCEDCGLNYYEAITD